MKSRTSAFLILLLTFALGAVSGAVGHFLFQKRANADSAGRPPARPGPRDIVEEMARDLGLSADQKAKLQVIIGSSREKYRDLSHQFRPQYEAIRRQSDQQIREILSESQRERFEKKIREMEKHRPQRRPDTPK